MTTTYAGWWQVPDHLMPATTLGELEYPRTANGQDPVAWVDTRDWSDRETSIPLYDARACPPSKATARQLAAVAARSGRQRTCAQCGARCQRPLTVDPNDRRPLCPACGHVVRLRRRQAELGAARQLCAEQARELLAWTGAAVLQVDLHVPPPTPAGRRRPPTAARVRAVDLDAARLVDMLVRLVGPRAHHVPDGAAAPQAAAPAIHRALVGRRLLLWSHQDLVNLLAAAPHDALPGVGEVHWAHDGDGWPAQPVRARAVALQHLATRWRGQLHPHTRTLVECLAPGTPDRLALLLRRIADTPPAPKPPAAELPAEATPRGVAAHIPTAQELAERCQPLARLAGVAGDFWTHAHNLLGTLEHLAATDPEVAVLHAQTELLIADYDQAKAAHDQAKAATATSYQAGAQPAGR
jgi:hypothetical protein